MSLAVFWMSAAGIFGSNTKTFGPKRAELAFGAELARATGGTTAHSTATATRTDTADLLFLTIAETPLMSQRSRRECSDSRGRAHPAPDVHAPNPGPPGGVP